MAPRTRPRSARPSQMGLGFDPSPDPLAVLVAERDRLLAQVAASKHALDSLIEKIRRVTGAAASRLAPFLVEVETLGADLHAMFRDLLGPGRLAAKARAGVAAVYASLQEDGVLPPPDFRAPTDEDALPSQGAGGFSARRPSADDASAESLRAVYRRLATAIHPDRVQDEDEKARRTEAMKDVTVAYGQGDLARLLEIERVWRAVPAASAGADRAQRIAAQKRANVDLRRQLRDLERELAQARRSPEGKARAASDLVKEAEGDLEMLRELRDFVKAFRDRKISLRRFLAGPVRRQRQDYEAAIAQALAEFVEIASTSRRPKRRRARG